MTKCLEEKQEDSFVFSPEELIVLHNGTCRCVERIDGSTEKENQLDERKIGRDMHRLMCKKKTVNQSKNVDRLEQTSLLTRITLSRVIDRCCTSVYTFG